MTDIVVSPLDMERWQDVRDLRLRAIAHDPQAFGSSYEKQSALSDEGWLAQFSQSQGESPTRLFAIARTPDRALGMIGAFADPKEPAAWNLTAVYLEPELRGQGVADRLMTSILDQVRAEGARRVHLAVNSEQVGAIRLYERFGFAETGRSHDVVMGDGLPHELLNMTLEIPD